jgi:hypothetical protein
MSGKSQKKFKVGIRRFTEGVRKYEVEAANEAEAEEKATELARNDDWTSGSSSSEFDTDSVELG